MSTGIALLLTLISYTQNPPGLVHATGNFLSVEQAWSNLQSPERRRTPQQGSSQH